MEDVEGVEVEVEAEAEAEGVVVRANLIFSRSTMGWVSGRDRFYLSALLWYFGVGVGFGIVQLRNDTRYHHSILHYQQIDGIKGRQYYLMSPALEQDKIRWFSIWERLIKASNI